MRHRQMSYACRQQALDVDAIEVGLDLWYAAARCQRLYKSYKGASNYGISYANADKGSKRGPESP